MIPGSSSRFRSFAALLGPSRKRGSDSGQEEEEEEEEEARAAEQTAAMATKGRPIFLLMPLLF